MPSDRCSGASNAFVRPALALIAGSVLFGPTGCDRGTATDVPTTPAVTPASTPAATPAAAVVPPVPAAPAPTAPSESVEGPPPIRVEPAILDFGIVAPSKSVQGSVKLINLSDRELEILTVQPSCKCTTLEDLSGRKIPPKGEFELKAEMAAQSGPGPKRADLKVLVDGYTQVLTIELRNEVSLPVRVSPPFLNVVSGQPTEGRVVVESVDRAPFRICSIGGRPPNFIGFDPAKDEPRNQYLIDWNLSRDFEDPKNLPRYWIIETDRADCPLADVFVRHESTLPIPALRLTEYRHTFGRIEQGQSSEFTIEVQDLPATERIVAAASTTGLAKVELLGTEVEGNITRVNLRVVPASDTLGVAYVPFSIFTNTKQQKVAVWGQVVPPGTTGCLGR